MLQEPDFTSKVENNFAPCNLKKNFCLSSLVSRSSTFPKINNHSVGYFMNEGIFFRNNDERAHKTGNRW